MSNRILNCLNLKSYDGIPLWFMRQAGRYLPEFRNLRKKNPNFVRLCLNTKLTTEISLQPSNRYDLDAVIIFSDILMIPYGLGQDLKFKKNFGPILNEMDIETIIQINNTDFIKKLSPIYKSIKEVKSKIDSKKKALIGFVGAPWTLLIYMLHKKSPKNNFNYKNITKDKFLINKLLNKLEKIICLHIDKQIEAGADVIQIFDSWAGLLLKKELPNFCYIPTLKIVEHIKSLKVPVICFPRGIKKNYIDFCSIVKPSCISIDSEVDPKWIRKKLKYLPIQGGLNPNILLEGKEKIKRATEFYLNAFIDYPYIFNLGHGVLPTTNPKTIEYIIKIVRDKR